MNKKLRYSLILLGFIVFFVLAPIIVLYVRGVNFDFKSRKFVQTGILAARADPKDAAVFLDGKLAAKTSGDIKFLIPKEYDISLKKNGYADWNKRLEVAEGQLTWGSPVNSQIYLFLSAPIASASADQVRDFYLSPDNTLIALFPGNLSLSSLANAGGGENINLPGQATEIIPSPDGKQFILDGNTSGTPVALHFNLASRKLTDLSAVFSEPVKWQFDQGGRLYALSGGGFYSVDPAAKQKTLLQKNILAASFADNNLYMLEQAAGTLEFGIAPDPSQEGQAILNGLPLFKNADIIISYEKQAYILGDGSLYKVDSALGQIASGISAWNFNSSESSLTFFHNGELDYINPYDHQLYFITRRGNSLTLPLIRMGLNNVFFAENNQVKTLELDTRDRQNEYMLYQGTAIKKISLDSSGKTLVVLDGDELKTITVR